MLIPWEIAKSLTALASSGSVWVVASSTPKAVALLKALYSTAFWALGGERQHGFQIWLNVPKANKADDPKPFGSIRLFVLISTIS